MERRGANSPLLIVCSLLSYSDNRLRFCRSWKVLTLKQLILLAFSSLKHKENLFRICYLSVFVYLFSFFFISVHCRIKDKHTQLMRFSFLKYISSAKPLLFVSSVPPFCLSCPVYAVMIMYFLAMTHKSENLGFMYSRLLFLSKRRLSSVGWECNILIWWERQMVRGKGREEEKNKRWRWNGMEEDNGERQWRDRRKI